MSLSKKTKIGLLVLVLLLTGSYTGWSYLYHAHPDTASRKVDFEGSVAELIKKLANGDALIAGSYLQITGPVTVSKQDVIILGERVFCQLNGRLNGKVLGSNLIIVKGRFIGYDDILEEIKLDQCIIIEKEK